VVLALGAGAAGATLLHSGQAGPQHVAVGHREPAWHTVSAMNSRTGAILTVRYAPRPWGTTMTVHVSGIRSGTVCEFQVTDNQGHHWVVGGWRVRLELGRARSRTAGLATARRPGMRLARAVL
jgi:hypothetical protein